MERRTSLFDNGLIWFGAGVSLAEILTGTYFFYFRLWKGLCSHYRRTCDRLCPSVFSRCDRRKEPFKRHGNGKEQLRQQRRFVFRPVKCITAGRLDCYYDL